jgi:hypothetical protein
MIETIRSETLVDLVAGNIGHVNHSDLDTRYHWAMADLRKENLGIHGHNLILDCDALPEIGYPGQEIRVQGIPYVWVDDGV